MSLHSPSWPIQLGLNPNQKSCNDDDDGQGDAAAQQGEGTLTNTMKKEVTYTAPDCLDIISIGSAR